MRYRNPDTSPVIGLIVINAALFLVTLLFPILVVVMGLRPSLVAAHPWTLFTAMFIHAGWLHIISNMLALYFFGTFLVNLVGSNTFLIIYFGAGIAGNLLMWALTPIFPFGLAVGASGAIFGLGGTLAVLRPKQPVYMIPIPVEVPLWVSVVIGFFIVLVFANVAWQAHLGGLLFGLIAGYLLRRRYRYY